MARAPAGNLPRNKHDLIVVVVYIRRISEQSRKLECVILSVAVLQAERRISRAASDVSGPKKERAHDAPNASPRQRPTTILHHLRASLYPHTLPQPRRPASRLGAALLCGDVRSV